MQQGRETDESRHAPDNGYFSGQFRWPDYAASLRRHLNGAFFECNPERLGRYVANQRDETGRRRSTRGHIPFLHLGIGHVEMHRRRFFLRGVWATGQDKDIAAGIPRARTFYNK